MLRRRRYCTYRTQLCRVLCRGRCRVMNNSIHNNVTVQSTVQYTRPFILYNNQCTVPRNVYRWPSRRRSHPTSSNRSTATAQGSLELWAFVRTRAPYEASSFLVLLRFLPGESIVFPPLSRGPARDPVQYPGPYPGRRLLFSEWYCVEGQQV